MTDNAASKKVEGKGSTPPAKARGAGNLTFWLVVIMLGILSALVILLVVIVLINSANDKIIEYSKWVLTTLVGTFGAWIGAGAAYFFGKESLVESGASTEAAMTIQQDTLQGAAGPKYIRELALTDVDDTFKFKSSDEKKDVIAKLDLPQYKGYWWVPVFDQGVLKDIIHARVFWDDDFKVDDSISKIVNAIENSKEKNAKFGALHDKSFFVMANRDAEVADMLDKMKKSGATVGIIVNNEGKPISCFTKQDLLNVQK
jgi:hypothetical protein